MLFDSNLVDDFLWNADALVTGCAGLGFKRLGFSSAGVDGILGRGHNNRGRCFDNRDDGWDNFFHNSWNNFFNNDWFGDYCILRCGTGGGQDNQN